MFRTFQITAAALLTAIVLLHAGCIIPYSKQMHGHDMSASILDGEFVSEEDQGLMLFGIIEIVEPEHYSVLIERARMRYDCRRITNVQLDYYQQFWILFGFNIARVTGICIKEEKTQPHFRRNKVRLPSYEEQEPQPAVEPPASPTATTARPEPSAEK